MRVAMGQKAALAFCLGARGYDVADYHYAPETSFSFRVVALGSAPPKPRVDLVATAPFRDLRGQAIAVNGTALPPDRYEFNAATAGEDVFIKGVGVGDVVTIGTPPTGPVAVEEGIPYRTGPQATTAPWQTVDLRRACNTALKRDWWEGDSWYGLTPGERTVWRIPVSLVDPDLNGGKDAVAGGNVTVGKPAGAVFAVIGALRNPAGAAPQTGKLKLTFAGGETRVVDALGDTPFDLTNGFPLRKFDTSLVAVDLGGQKMIQSLTIEGGTLLALALGDGRAPAVRSALAQAEAARSRTLATRTQKYYQTPARACSEDRSESRPWAARSDPWRFRLTVRPAAFERVNAVVNAREDFAALLRQIGCTGRADAQSLYAFEVDGGGPGRPVPVQFDALAGGDGQRGELLLTIPGRTAPGQARSFDVYFGPKPSPAATKSSALWPDITGDYARVNTGKGGLAFEFRLDGTDENPRWTRLSFASGKDADPVAGANVLGKSGFNGGFADLTCCTDYVKWYDFGGVQTTPARARIVNSGPVATTVMVSGLEMSGKEDAPAGKADWMFRFYPGKPVLEQWLDYEVTNLDNAWTRALQVRYGLNRWERGSNRTIGGHPVACADEVTVAPLEDAATTLTPQCMYTPDGHVLQIAFTEPDAVGSYFTGRWITLPGGLSDSEYLAAIEAPAVEQFGVEELVQRKVVRRTLEPTALVEFDRTGGKGPGPQPVTREVVAAAGNINPDPSFEQKDAFWALGTADTEARWTTTQAYSGHVAVDLSCTDKTLSIACTNARAGHALDIAPNARYEVSFWAKCTSGEGEIQTSFFSSEPGCDFPHIISTVPADGKWHQVQIEVPTGAFRAGDANAGVFARSQRMTPSLRLWTYHKAQKTYVDQVEVRRIR